MDQQSVKKETLGDDIQVLTTQSTILKKELEKQTTMEHPRVDKNLNVKPKVEEEKIKILSSAGEKETKKKKEEPIISTIDKSPQMIQMDKPSEMIKTEKPPEIITIEDKVPEKVLKVEIKEEIKKVPVVVLDEENERKKEEKTKKEEEEEVMVVDEEKVKETKEKEKEVKKEDVVLEKEILAPPTKKLKVEESPEKKVTFGILPDQGAKLELPKEKGKEEEQQQQKEPEVEMMETSKITPDETKSLGETTTKMDENQNPEETPKRKVQKRKTILKVKSTTPPTPARALRNRSELHKPDVFQPEPIKMRPHSPKKRRSSGSTEKRLKQQATPPQSQGQPLSLKTLPQVVSSALCGLTFVITGTLPSFHRDTIADFIVQHGGRVTKALSKKTNFMVVGHDPGEKKLIKARELHKACLSEDEFLDLVRQMDVPDVKPQAA